MGASVAYQLSQRYPGLKVTVIEKESEPAKHQTGRNSGVIHAGVYYEPGSLKATFCREGLKATIAFCQDHGLPFLQCGKLIVATNDQEEQRLHALFQRSQENQLTTRLLSQSQLRALEPNITGQSAIHVEETGITDYQAITRAMLDSVVSNGGSVAYQQEVTDLYEDETCVKVNTQHHTFQANWLINCAGLHCDRLAKIMGVNTDIKIVPFRGEYYQLPSRYNDIVKHLIYPVPDPQMPFLGVHLTRMIDGSVTVGPNAVLALAREGYSKADYSFKDALETLTFPGFWKLASTHAKSGFGEMRDSLFKKGYLARVQKYAPDIQLDDLLPYPSGVRAQAVSAQGKLIHDFVFHDTPRSLHVGNAPSPAATSAIPIGKEIISRLADRLDVA